MATKIPAHIKIHFTTTFRALGIRPSAYIAALETVVKPSLLIYIKKYIAATFRAASGFPHCHIRFTSA
jgi:hypothetical protein